MPDFSEMEIDFEDESHWAMPIYLQDSLAIYGKRNGEELTHAELVEGVLELLFMPEPLRASLPIHVAFCATQNLQSYILGADIEGERLWEHIVQGNDVFMPGLKTIRRKGKVYLNLRWDQIAKEFIGMEDEVPIEIYTLEREDACSVGAFDVIRASQVDKRLKGILLDCSVLID